MIANRAWLDYCLAALAFLSALAIVLSIDDPFARRWLCSHVPCPEWLGRWRQVAFSLGIGSLISLLFYALVVRLPEYQRRHRLKRSFEGRYRLFKEDCIHIMVGLVSKTAYDPTIVDRLVDPNEFYRYFSEDVSSSQSRWHVFLNELDEYSLQRLKTLMEIFREDITFILSSVDIPDDRPFEFLRRLSAAIQAMQDTTLDYDETKYFGGFLWEVFAGWNFIEGKREKDIVEEMIERI